MDLCFERIVRRVQLLNGERFPFVPDASQIEMFGKLNSKTAKAEGILRLRGNIAERILCSKYSLPFKEDGEKKTIRELLQELNIIDCSSNLTPDAHSITEDGKLMLYEFGISRNRRAEKEFSDRQKWKKICEKYPVLVHVEVISSFDEIENPYVRLSLQNLEKLMIDFFKNLDRNEELREINLKYFWEIRDLFQQYPYLNKFRLQSEEITDERSKVLKQFPDLDRTNIVKTETNIIANQIKNVVKDRIKGNRTFYRETNKKSLNELWQQYKLGSLTKFRNLKHTKLGFKKADQKLTDYFNKNSEVIAKLNEFNKEKKLKKLDYSYVFAHAGVKSGLVPGPHDSLRWLEVIIQDCENKLKNGGKNAKEENIHILNCYKKNEKLIKSFEPMPSTIAQKLKLLEQQLTKPRKATTQENPNSSHNENFVLKCAKKRIDHWTLQNLQVVEDTSVCILRSANTSYTYKTSFLCFQKFNNQIIFYKTRGHKTKQFGLISDNDTRIFTAHPSRYICPVNIKLCLKNIELEYNKLTPIPMTEEFRNCLVEILINQNKTTQKNLQNIRYLIMALKSNYHSSALGKKLSSQLKNDKNCVDYWLIKKIYETYIRTGAIYPFEKTDNQQLETRKMLFVSYLCNLITKDSQEKDIERIKANRKYFELKQNWETERGWRLNNGLSIEEVAYGDISGPTLSPAVLDNFYSWFKIECLDYLDKFAFTKLKEPLAFDISNSNSCLTQVKSKKYYSKTSIQNQLKKHHETKLRAIRGEKQEKNLEINTKIKQLNDELSNYINFYKESGNEWVIESLKTIEPFQLCSNLPFLDNLKEIALTTIDEDAEDDLTNIIKQRILMSDDPDALHLCLLLKIKSIKDELRIVQKQTTALREMKFQNKLSSRNSTAIELLNEIRKEKIKNNEIISELTCLDLLEKLPDMNFALSYKEQVGGTRELYIGDIKTKIATKIVEEFAKQIKDLNPISCLYDHSSEMLIRKHVRNCQTANATALDLNYEDFLNLNEEQLSSIFVEKEEYLFGSLDHSKWGPLSMPSLFADLMDIFNESVKLIGTAKSDLTLISDILWKHVMKKVEVSSEYAEFLVKNENTQLKTSINYVEKNELKNETDDYAKKLLNDGKLGMQTYPYDMGQGILHGWSDIWAGKTEEFIWQFIRQNLRDYTDVYNCVTSDDQATVLLGPESALFILESHYVLSKCLNKKISEKSVWGSEVFEFKSVFVSGGQELPPTIKYLIIPSFGFEVFEPLGYLNTTDTVIQEAYDNCATVEQCANLLEMSKKLLACAGFGNQYLSDLSEKHFYSKKIHATMFDDLSFTERKLMSLKESQFFKKKENKILIAEIDEELSNWMKYPHLCVERAKIIAKKCQDTSWDPLMYGPIRVCSGRIKNNKENNIILSLDPSRNIDDPICSKLYNFIRKHFQSTTYSSLEQSIIESIKDSLRQMSSGENYSGLVATIRSQSFKLSSSYGSIHQSKLENRQTILEDYLQLKIQLLIEKFSLDEKHFYPTVGVDEKPIVSTVMKGSKINDDFLVPALASLELRAPLFFKSVVEPNLPVKKLKLMNSQQLVRMKLIECADASFNMEVREPYEVFRLTSLNNNSTFYQGNDGISWEATESVGISRRIYDLKQVETMMLLNSFVKPTPVNYETILENWRKITNAEFPNNVPVDGSILQILIANSINEKRQAQVCELLKSFPQHLSEKRTYQDQFSIIISREILWEQQSVTISFSRNKQQKTNEFTIYWDLLPRYPTKRASKQLLEKLLDLDQILEWHLIDMRIKNKTKLQPNLFDKLSSPVYIKEGSLGYYKYVDGIPAFQEIHTPKLEHNSITSQLDRTDICLYLESILESYSEIGRTIYEGMVDTKPDYLTTHAGNIMTFKSSVCSCINLLPDGKKLKATKLFTSCFDESIVVNIGPGYLLCRPGMHGWVYSDQSAFKKSTSKLIESLGEIPNPALEESWLD
ncbi:RNA dependent RNA polymerase [big electron-dense squares virus 1]|uniref:RNA-directed RNA polymerase L n=1 Tax=big electron-dense squares virus 1 TaxID=3070918 RepID=A0AA46RXK1_9VIRU|nr:RNA dependent RNA polymerase [big electron-dense squares virus 1]UVT34684.1 RNA dependent RNA polymerase [big electron-dense squares virus 1]